MTYLKKKAQTVWIWTIKWIYISLFSHCGSLHHIQKAIVSCIEEIFKEIIFLKIIRLWDPTNTFSEPAQHIPLCWVAKAKCKALVLVGLFTHLFVYRTSQPTFWMACSVYLRALFPLNSQAAFSLLQSLTVGIQIQNWSHAARQLSLSVVLP